MSSLRFIRNPSWSLLKAPTKKSVSSNVFQRSYGGVATLPQSHPQKQFTDDQLAAFVRGWTRSYSPGLLSKQELDQFYSEGFVIKHDVFDRKDPVLLNTMKAVSGLVDDIANALHRAGKIKDLHNDAGFYQRLTMIEKQYPDASVLLHKHGVLPPAFSALWSDPRLLSAAQQVLGPELFGHPVWNLRCKTPQQEQATVPWHQDTGYLHPSCWHILQLTAWIPLLDANTKNGCMQVLRRGHLPGITAQHVGCWRGTWYLDLAEQEMTKTLGVNMEKDVVTCEVPLGSVLFLNNLIPHRSLDNNSDEIRWSLDLRWQNTAEPNGFYGLKESIKMKTAADPNFRPDWENWGKINRQQLQQGQASAAPAHNETQFDPIISGPWMETWPLVNQNRHTRAYKPNTTSWHKA